ncbi:uncharacterized protein YALI1_F39923g [Yarrowia lipolytica]|uniref:Uncharacterized protein n=1 Tax=Yarrowia lipolytica TaxID=4952 RepID=A0A1D8NQU0_YARLL|nr:hypothetical protein YALI1_F39923g [Yarrowia lipolytica]
MYEPENVATASDWAFELRFGFSGEFNTRGEYRPPAAKCPVSPVTVASGLTANELKNAMSQEASLGPAEMPEPTPVSCEQTDPTEDFLCYGNALMGFEHDTIGLTFIYPP